MADFGFNERELRKMVEKEVKDAATKTARQDLDREMSALLRTHRGRPVEEIKPAAKTALQRAGIKQPGNDQITKVSEAVSRGEKPRFGLNFRMG